MYAMFPVVAAITILSGCADAHDMVAAKSKMIDVEDQITLPTTVAQIPFAGIPAKFHGRYDASISACEIVDYASEGMLRVDAGQVDFFASSSTVTSVLTDQNGSITILGIAEGEGERWVDMRRLALSDDGAILTVTGGADAGLAQTDVDRVRCPEQEQTRSRTDAAS